jgi:hypothetical protein
LGKAISEDGEGGITASRGAGVDPAKEVKLCDLAYDIRVALRVPAAREFRERT